MSLSGHSEVVITVTTLCLHLTLHGRNVMLLFVPLGWVRSNTALTIKKQKWQNKKRKHIHYAFLLIILQSFKSIFDQRFNEWNEKARRIQYIHRCIASNDINNTRNEILVVGQDNVNKWRVIQVLSPRIVPVSEFEGPNIPQRGALYHTQAGCFAGNNFRFP